MDLYSITLVLHNWVRWGVLIIGVVAVGNSILGWVGSRDWTSRDRIIGSLFGILLDIQVLLGLLLYFVLSPITRAALQNFGAAMGNETQRFFALEHVFYMLLAVVFVHVGSVMARRGNTDRAKFSRAAIFFTLALLMILLGIPWMSPLLRI